MSRIANNSPGSGAYISSYKFGTQNLCISDQSNHSSRTGCSHAYTPTPVFHQPPVRIPACAVLYQPYVPGSKGIGGGKQAYCNPSFGKHASHTIANCRGGQYHPPASAWKQGSFCSNSYFGQTGNSYNHKSMRYAAHMFNRSGWSASSGGCNPVHGFSPEHGSANGKLGDCERKKSHEGDNRAHQFFSGRSSEKGNFCSPSFIIKPKK